MTKTETTVRAAQIATEARNAIARAKGELAACHRKTVAGLMPKFETDGEADAWVAGFQNTRAALD